ncbi:hypothetical protein D3C75_980650 [compost metagenome]
MQDAIVQALFPQRRLVHIGQATAERQVLVIPQGVGQQAHGHALFGFRRVTGDGLTDVFVHAAVEVGQVQFEFVGGGRLGHGRRASCAEKK